MRINRSILITFSIIIIVILIIIIIIIIHKTTFIVLSSTARSLCESSLWVLQVKVGQRQVAASQLVGQPAYFKLPTLRTESWHRSCCCNCRCRFCRYVRLVASYGHVLVVTAVMILQSTMGAAIQPGLVAPTLHVVQPDATCAGAVSVFQRDSTPANTARNVKRWSRY